MKYQIEIRETLSRTVEIESDSFDNALGAAKAQYRNENIVLSSEDFVNVEFILHDEHFNH